MRGAAAPFAILIVLFAIGGTITWMRSASVARTDSDLLGASRTELETRYGRAMFTARKWKLGTRESVRTGGLRMQHTKLTLHALKPGRGLGSSPTHRILLWIEDDTVLDFAQRVTRGSLREYDFPTSIAVDHPGRIRLVELDDRSRVSQVEEIRPAFVIADPN